MAAKKIFISYSRNDLDTVTYLVDYLRGGGLDVWFDHHIRSGDQWDEVIEQQIKEADVIVVVLSKTSVASDNVMDEVSYAISRDKRISPIRIEDCEIPMRIARFHYIDYSEGNENALKRLVSDIQFDGGTAPKPDEKEEKKEEEDKPTPSSRKGLKITLGIIVLIILGFGAVRWLSTDKPTVKKIPVERREIKTVESNFFMRVGSFYNNDGRTMVSGTVSKGQAVSGSLVDVVGNNGVVLTAKIQLLSDGQKYVSRVNAGQRVNFQLSGVSVRDLKKGMIICTPGSIK